MRQLFRCAEWTACKNTKCCCYEPHRHKNNGPLDTVCKEGSPDGRFVNRFCLRTTVTLNKFIDEFFEDAFTSELEQLSWSRFCALLDLDVSSTPRDPRRWLAANDSEGTQLTKLRAALKSKVVEGLRLEFVLQEQQ